MKSEKMNGTSKVRLLSLDVFRGITVAAMILVNNPGSFDNVYSPLEHAKWNGCTPTDLIFPFFLFIVGISIVFSLETKKAEIADHGKLMLNVTRRTFILFALGLFLALFSKFDLHTVRIPGVLQRIGVVFFFSALVFIKTNTRFQFWLLWSLLISYFIVMCLVPVPGTGHPSLQPESNMGAWLDRELLTPAHLYKAAKTWDPEGILSTFPAVATCLFGILTGTWLKRKDKNEAEKTAWLFTVGVLALLAGLAVDLFFPINKSLWTSSYVLYAGGWAVLVLSMLYWVIDVQGYKRFTKPFVVYGVNAITVFFLSGLLVRIMNIVPMNLNGKAMGLKVYLYQLIFAPYFTPVNASLIYAICFTLLWLLILWWMYNKKIIIKI